MRLIHTSDWHLGRLRNGKSFEQTHNLFFKWLIDFINQNKVDLLLVSGDIFDNPYPSTNVLSFYYKILFELSQTHLKKIIITGGNHDSASVLNAPKEILDRINISVIGGMPENLEQSIIEVESNGVCRAIVCAVPFLREKDLRKSVVGNDVETKKTEIAQAIANLYNAIYEKAKIMNKKNVPIIAMGHLFVSDVNSFSEKEMELFIGGLQQLSLNQLPKEFDYFALGHIHRPTIVGGMENIRYSGSPIKLNFSEKTNSNVIILVDTAENTIETIEVPIFRDLVKFQGTFKEVSEAIAEFKSKSPLKPWAKLSIVEQQKMADLENKIIDLKENIKNIDIVDYKFEFTDISNTLKEKYQKSVSIKEFSPLDVFEMYIDNYNQEEKDILKETFCHLQNNYLYENPII